MTNDQWQMENGKSSPPSARINGSTDQRINDPSPLCGDVLILPGYDDLQDTVLPRLALAACLSPDALPMPRTEDEDEDEDEEDEDGRAPLTGPCCGYPGGADLSRIAALTHVHDTDTPNDSASSSAGAGCGAGFQPAAFPASSSTTIQGRGRRFNLATDLPTLDARLAQNPNLKLIIIDSLSTHLHGRAVQNAPAILDALADLARIRGVAILITAKGPRQGGGGAARALLEVAPIVWTLTHDPEDLLGQRRHCLTRKNNLSPRQFGLSYTIGPDQRYANTMERLDLSPRMNELAARYQRSRTDQRINESTNQRINDIPAIYWSPYPIYISPDDPRSADEGRLGRKATQLHAAKEFLLRHHTWPDYARNIIDSAHCDHISETTLRRAARALGMIIYRVDRLDDWFWRLPHVPPPRVMIRNQWYQVGPGDGDVQLTPIPDPEAASCAGTATGDDAAPDTPDAPAEPQTPPGAPVAPPALALRAPQDPQPDAHHQNQNMRTNNPGVPGVPGAPPGCKARFNVCA
jgi:hypothetical protein